MSLSRLCRCSTACAGPKDKAVSMVCLGKSSLVLGGSRLGSSASAYFVISRFCGRPDVGYCAGDVPFAGAGDDALSWFA